jgi:molybdenum cofactor cytidylyltransferase
VGSIPDNKGTEWSSVRRAENSVAALVLGAEHISGDLRLTPLLPVGDVSLIEHLLRTLRKAGLRHVGVVADESAMRLEPILRHYGATTLHATGPAGNALTESDIAASLPAGIDKYLLVSLAFPLVRPATIEHLVHHYAPPKASVVYPVFAGKRGRPLLIRRTLYAEIMENGAHETDRPVLAEYEEECDEVEVFDEGILLNMDKTGDQPDMELLTRPRELPSPAECEAILSSFVVSDAVLRHSRAVTRVAGVLVNALANAGQRLDAELVHASCMLHDLAKGQPNHAEAGAAIVADIGFPQVADVIAEHARVAYAGGEPGVNALVFLADKLVREDRVVSLEERFSPSFAQLRNHPAALQLSRQKYETACAISGAIEARIGLRVDALLAHAGTLVHA